MLVCFFFSLPKFSSNALWLLDYFSKIYFVMSRDPQVRAFPGALGV
jgi:hypothetical protein